MRCPNCQEETSATNPYCDFCGFELAQDFDTVAAEFVRETEEEKMEKIEREVRNYLALSIFLLFVSLCIYYALPSPVDYDAVAPYLHRVVQKKEEKGFQIPLELRLPE